MKPAECQSFIQAQTGFAVFKKVIQGVFNMRNKEKAHLKKLNAKTLNAQSPNFMPRLKIEIVN